MFDSVVNCDSLYRIHCMWIVLLILALFWHFVWITSTQSTLPTWNNTFTSYLLILLADTDSMGSWLVESPQGAPPCIHCLLWLRIMSTAWARLSTVPSAVTVGCLSSLGLQEGKQKRKKQEQIAVTWGSVNKGEKHFDGISYTKQHWEDKLWKKQDMMVKGKFTRQRLNRTKQS